MPPPPWGGSGGTLTDSLIAIAISCLGGVVLGFGIHLYLKLVGQELVLFLVGLIFTVSFLSDALHLESALMFIVAGFVIANWSEHGDRLIKEVERLSTPVFVACSTLAGAKPTRCARFHRRAGHCTRRGSSRALLLPPIAVPFGADQASQIRLDGRVPVDWRSPSPTPSPPPTAASLEAHSSRSFWVGWPSTSWLARPCSKRPSDWPKNSHRTNQTPLMKPHPLKPTQLAMWIGALMPPHNPTSSTQKPSASALN